MADDARERAREIAQRMVDGWAPYGLYKSTPEPLPSERKLVALIEAEILAAEERGRKDWETALIERGKEVYRLRARLRQAKMNYD